MENEAQVSANCLAMGPLGWSASSLAEGLDLVAAIGVIVKLPAQLWTLP